MGSPLRGIFPVLQTAVSEDGGLDIPSFKKEVAFCIDGGAHGLVFPVLGGEFQFLKDDERKRLAEVVVLEAGGQVPVVIGVAGPSKAVAVEHAGHAAKIGADAVIALPPFISRGSKEENRDYYEGIAKAAGIPVFIQHTFAGMDADFLVELLEGVENISYIKEEMEPSAHQISAVLENAGDSCLGVFGGAHGRWMLSELHRGACGFMPAAESTDVHVQIWDAYHSGDEARAREIFNQLLPLINLICILGLRTCKEILVRREVLASSAMRMPGATLLDAEDERELEIIMESLKPLYRL